MWQICDPKYLCGLVAFEGLKNIFWKTAKCLRKKFVIKKGETGKCKDMENPDDN